MEIGKILISVTGTDASLVTLDTALEVGRHLSAHVEGLHARRNALEALAYISEGTPGAMIEQLITTVEGSVRAKLRERRKHVS